jgi:hypothetical protein
MICEFIDINKIMFRYKLLKLVTYFSVAQLAYS